mgnify:CR=1 FL=1
MRRQNNALQTTVNNSDVEKPSKDIKSFEYVQCDYVASCKVSLKKHIEKEHIMIPQIDGLDDKNDFEEKSVQTETSLLRRLHADPSR